MNPHCPHCVHQTGLPLAKLARVLDCVQAHVLGDASVTVFDVKQDSRRVERGDLFVARRGAQTDGLAHVRHALERGASAVLVERGAPVPALSVPLVEVTQVRLATALAAEAVHGHPTRSLPVVGITGTNGKTTTVWLVQHALNALGARAARLGTLGFAFASEESEGSLTTPEADELSRLAAKVRAAGGTQLVMEVSSHALDQQRVHGLRFDVAGFTNLTQDHLDYHADMDAYAKAKEQLFQTLRPRAAVINVDDPYGRQIAERFSGRVIRYGRTSEADVRPVDVVLDARGMDGRVAWPGGDGDAADALGGRTQPVQLALRHRRAVGAAL
ncbi:Mur ligase family protein [Myxococcota bacterium]